MARGHLAGRHSAGGLLLVNKPSGPTSYDLIRWIKRKIHPSTPRVKIGHCGTLDPMASGLMIILIGAATKKQSELMGQNKVYRCVMRLGVATDTGDIFGHLKETKPVPVVNDRMLDAVKKRFFGHHLQMPPMYSALKKDGVPLYKLARRGQTIERTPRPIRIDAIEFLSCTGADIEFRVQCSSGTYIRTLVEDIGRELGSVATMASLVREKIGDCTLSQALPGEDLKTMDQEKIWAKLTPLL